MNQNVLKFLFKLYLKLEVKYDKKERMFRLSVSVKVHTIKTCKNWTVQGLSKLSDTLFLGNDLGHKGNINVKYGKQTKQIAPEVFKTL